VIDEVVKQRVIEALREAGQDQTPEETRREVDDFLALRREWREADGLLRVAREARR
jgi:hypothetical protein